MMSSINPRVIVVCKHVTTSCGSEDFLSHKWDKIHFVDVDVGLSHLYPCTVSVLSVICRTNATVRSVKCSHTLSKQLNMQIRRGIWHIAVLICCKQ